MDSIAENGNGLIRYLINKMEVKPLTAVEEE